jgi:hypothetical protein
MKRRRRIGSLGLLVLLLGAGAAPLWARRAPPRPMPVKLTAKLSNRFNWDLKRDNAYEDISVTYTELNAEAKWLPNPRVQMVAGEWMVNGDLRPYNIFANFSTDHTNVRVGNQIVRWGKADEISTLDSINPEDLTQGLTRDRASRKIPLPMINAELLSTYISLQGIYAPYWEKSKFLTSGDDWAFFDHLERKYGPINVMEEERAKTLRDGTYGARLSGTLLRVDYAFSYLNHRRDIPSLKAFPLPMPALLVTDEPGSIEDLVRFSRGFPIPVFPFFFPAQPIRFEYLREEVYGFEFETVAGPFGIRGDAAYISSQSFTTDNLQTIRKPVVSYVIGADYNGPANTYFNVSYKRTEIRDYEKRIAPPRTSSEISAEMTLEILNGNVRPAYRGYFNTTDKSYYQNPRVSIHYIPNVTVEVGIDLYGGPASSQAGFFTANDQAYTLARFFF